MALELFLSYFSQSYDNDYQNITKTELKQN